VKACSYNIWWGGARGDDVTAMCMVRPDERGRYQLELGSYISNRVSGIQNYKKAHNIKRWSIVSRGLKRYEECNLHAAADRPGDRVLEEPLRQPVTILIEAIVLLLFNPHLARRNISHLQLASITAKTTHLALRVLPVQGYWLGI
jgi:hypothetical protein